MQHDLFVRDQAAQPWIGALQAQRCTDFPHAQQIGVKRSMGRVLDPRTIDERRRFEPDKCTTAGRGAEVVEREPDHMVEHRQIAEATVVPVSYTHLTLPTSDLV